MRILWFKLFFFCGILSFLLFFGTLVGQQAPRVAAQLPTPWMGVMERISVYAPMLWVSTLAIILFRAEKESIKKRKTHAKK